LNETFSKEKIENIIFNDSSVKDYHVFNFKINNKDAKFKNYTSEWNERFIENNLEDAITVI